MLLSFSWFFVRFSDYVIHYFPQLRDLSDAAFKFSLVVLLALVELLFQGFVLGLDVAVALCLGSELPLQVLVRSH